MREFLKKHVFATICAVVALMIAGSGSFIYAQDSSTRLFNSLFLSGEPVDTAFATAQLIAGYDGADVQFMAVDSSGNASVSIAAPSGSSDSVIAVDQSDDDTYAIPATAYETTCQNQGDEDVMVRAGSASGGTTGFVMGAGNANLDGTGGSYTSKLQGVTLYFYNVETNTANNVYCASDTL